MIIVMGNEVTDEQVDGSGRKVWNTAGLKANISRGAERTVIGAIGDERPLDRGNVRPAARGGTVDAHRQAIQNRVARIA